MDRLGLSYETLAEINPRLVYGSLRGFGDRRTGSSPYVDWPAFDVVAQAMGGMMTITGAEAGGTPTKVGPGVGDTIPGLMCQSAFDRDPGSASKRTPFDRGVLLVALVSSELAGIAEARRARVV
jgi:hypothetical protein